jgi:hypothetical protein
METLAICFCCVVITGLYALSADAMGGDDELFGPMNQSCATERATHATLRTIRDYAKTSRSDLMTFFATTTRGGAGEALRLPYGEWQFFDF